jgi:hypothetical protein
LNDAIYLLAGPPIVDVPLLSPWLPGFAAFAGDIERPLDVVPIRLDCPSLPVPAGPLKVDDPLPVPEPSAAMTGAAVKASITNPPTHIFVDFDIFDSLSPK